MSPTSSPSSAYLAVWRRRHWHIARGSPMLPSTARVEHRAREDHVQRSPSMTLTRQTMTDEQRKSVAVEYLKAFDNGGVTSTGESILELFAPDAQVAFPKWGIANGREEIGRIDRKSTRLNSSHANNSYAVFCLKK